MIPTKHVIYCGTWLEVPTYNGMPLHMPFDNWEDWEQGYCGAGDGWGEKLVPEKFPGGTVATACCYIHDEGRKLCKCREDFAQNDRMFCVNMVMAVFAHHPLDVIGKKEHTDLLWAISYYMAVDVVKS